MKIKVKAIANAKKSTISLEKDENGFDVYKVKISAKAQDGEANDAIIAALAKYFSVKKSSINLLSGSKSRDKIFEIEGI